MRTGALKIALIYMFLGALWILSSDELVGMLSRDSLTLTRLQTIKGWAFIVITGVVLYCLVARLVRQLGIAKESETELRQERERLIGQLTQERDDLTALTQVTANAISTLNLNELLNTLLARLVAVMRADTGVILLIENDELKVRATLGLDEALESGYAVPLGKCFAGTIALTKKPLYISDAQVDPQVLNPYVKKRGVRTMLGVPLKRNGHVFGVLHVDWLNVHPQNERELHLLEITAERCATAILNARLFEQTKSTELALRENIDQLNKKNRYESIISTVTRSVHKSIVLQDVLENTVDAMSENIKGVDNVSIYLVEDSMAVMKASRGYPDWFIERVRSIPYPKGFTWKAIIDGEPIYCPDVDQDTLIGPAGREVGTKSYVSMPIFLGGEAVGCININSFEKNTFDEDDLKLLEIVSRQIQTALNNVKQVEALRQSQEEIKKLNEELERRVEERTAQLEAANKELEAFSYSVSHDLRAPLRAIDGFSRMLIEDYTEKLDGEGRRLLEVIRDNTRNMGQLIDDLLSFSRLGRQEMNLTFIEIEKLVRPIFEELISTENGRTVEFNINNLPPAKVDRAMIKQVFANLLSNAIKFTGTRERAVIEAGGWDNGIEKTYYIRDNGVGFDMNYVDKLFGVFQRLHSQGEFEGTGVGLALVKRIIHRHGGRVWAEGKVGEGATFYFTLPGEGGIS